jgi:hypothetical protein
VIVIKLSQSEWSKNGNSAVLITAIMSAIMHITVVSTYFDLLAELISNIGFWQHVNLKPLQ